MKINTPYTLLILATLLTGCRVGPNHCVPPVEMPEEWISSGNMPVDPDHSLVDWWCQFNDPFLNEYIERIFTDNLDIQIALERVSQAYFQRSIASGKLFPQIDGEILKNRSKPGSFGFLTSPGVAAAILDIQQENIQYQFNCIWEVDLFGRIRRQIESAAANIGVQIEIKNGLLISALSEFVRNYFEFRANQQLMVNTQEQIALLKDELNLTRNRYTAGIARDQDIQTIEESLKNLEATLPPIQINLYSSAYRLSVLIGQNPDYLLESLLSTGTNLSIPDTIPGVMPSELLLRRPDIRQAERLLAENTADLGVAYAEFFPRINLTGIEGYQRIKVQDLLLKGNLWSFGFDALQPIFRGGQIKNNILFHESLRSEAFIGYRKTVLLALEETENALLNFINASVVYQDALSAYTLQQNLYTHAESQYSAGSISKLDLYNAKRSLLVSQNNVINTEMQAGISLTYLYKALGGGW
jgi:multidrug efflux system outer membrane protein